MLERYDKAVLEHLRLTDAGEKVPLGMATPRREFGQQSEKTGAATPARQNQTIPLPSMVISRLSWLPAPGRASFVRQRKLKYTDDLNKVAQARMPLPYDISYQLDIWTKYREDANLLAALTTIKFPYEGMAQLSVDLGYPWGARSVTLHCGEVIDNTDLDPGEDGDRECRMTVDLTLEAWLPLPPRDVRTVRKVVEDLQIMWFEDARGVDAVPIKGKVIEEA